MTSPGVPRARIRQCRVPVTPTLRPSASERSVIVQSRCIGMDVHRDFCEVAIWDAGEVSAAPRVPARPEQLLEFAQQLRPTDRVAMEATSNALAIARIIGPHVGGVEIVNTRRLKAISESKQKTDRH